jgi:hypothetical protein
MNLETIAVENCLNYISKMTLALKHENPHTFDIYSDLYHRELIKIKRPHIRTQIERQTTKIYERRLQ